MHGQIFYVHRTLLNLINRDKDIHSFCFFGKSNASQRIAETNFSR